MQDEHSLTFDSQHSCDFYHITTGNSLHSRWHSDAIGMVMNWTSAPWVARYIGVIWVTYHLKMCYNYILSTQDMLDHCAHQGLPAARLHRGTWLNTTDQCLCDIRPFWCMLHWIITAGTVHLSKMYPPKCMNPVTTAISLVDSQNDQLFWYITCESCAACTFSMCNVGSLV